MKKTVLALKQGIALSLPWLPVLLGSALLFHSALAGATSCNQVSIETVNPLDFGKLRMQKNLAGWAVVDGMGGLIVSPGLAISNKQPPMPGRIRISAPANSILQLTLQTPFAPTTSSVQLLSTELFAGIQPLTRNGNSWEFKTAESPDHYVEQILSIGGEIQIPPSRQPQALAIQLQVACLAIQPAI